MKNSRHAILGFSLIFSILGCQASSRNDVQGYVEGEFLYLAAPSSGKLCSLAVEKGTEVLANSLLFSIDATSEQKLRDEAAESLKQAQANLEDAKKGKRSTEISAIEAQMKQAQSAFTLAEQEYDRQEKLSHLPGVTSKQDFDRARSAREQSREKVTQLQSELETARLGARVDQVNALEAAVGAKASVLAKTEWDLSQKIMLAPATGLVFDTLYHPGEWVMAGRPVMIFLPPERIKVRAYVPELRIGNVRLGQLVEIHVDGRPEPLAGTVNYIATRPEFTPPVIYSRDNRSKLSFLIEITFAPETAKLLHPGQPVDARLGS